ncbi:homeobox-leucine zipper protein ROC8-like [Zingiber officinale]|uniref:homeobox-leucine zipper protein ROC8-like n=1 Tax=Zingiber officinale TaxID=94328 RepID=UPI001C4D4360|nr:homeobox-leucine zipper protein ROC8-like [Zingiber officinale]
MASGGDRNNDLEQTNESAGRRKERMYRHTPQQIQELEATFAMHPHPDDKQRARLSRELGLDSRQIKFWFQNRRTLMKAHNEKSDNCTLRADNDRIRSENVKMKERLRKTLCNTCCQNNPAGANPYFDEQKLRMENARLKEEVDRVANITSKYFGRPSTHHLPLPQQDPILQSEDTLENFITPSVVDQDLPGNNPTLGIPYPFQQILDHDKPFLMNLASNAMEEVIQLLQSNEPFWIKSTSDGREVLQLQAYQMSFPKSHQSDSGTRTEASRDSSIVMMSGRMLVDAFMNSNKWMELFPTIVSNATTIDVVTFNVTGNTIGSVILMYQELQILSPLVPTRELFVLRCSKQIEPNSWVIVDVSVDYLLGNNADAFAKKLPSGCLISEMQNGCSKVTWVEHMEIQEKNPIHTFQNIVTTGVAFEARRWVSSLRRMAERNTLFISAAIADDLGGVIPTPEAKQSTMKLAQRMVERFCDAFSGSITNKWIVLSGPNDAHQVYFHKTNSFGLSGQTISATASVWLPFNPERLFGFLKDEQNRNLWEVSDEEVKFQRLAHFVNGSNTGNSISLLNEIKSTTNLLMLQESCIDATGSLIVYSPLELSTMDKIMRGEDMSLVQVMVSGFMIIPDNGFAAAVGGAASSSSAPAAQPMGSLLTLGLQIEAADLRKESVSAINRKIGLTMEKIKAVMASFT